MRTIWIFYVDTKYILSSDQEETLEDFLTIYTPIIYDILSEESEEKAKRVTDKIKSRDFVLYSSIDGDLEEIEITVED